ncbi:Transcription initiation factor TFIID subunit 7 [Bienertia sinuspersici]
MKNWVVRTGSQYGVDYVAYRHHPALVHSEYAVLVLAERNGNSSRRLSLWSDLYGTIRLCGGVAKMLLVLHVLGINDEIDSPICLKNYQVETRTICRWIPQQTREKKNDAKLCSENETQGMEEQFILRVPPSVAERIERVLNEDPSSSEDKSLDLSFLEDGRTGTFMIGNEQFPASLLDLPCVTESYKTYDDNVLIKAADIGQMIMVREGNDVAPETVEYRHGLTPPMRDARRRRFVGNRISIKRAEAAPQDDDGDENARNASKKPAPAPKPSPILKILLTMLERQMEATQMSLMNQNDSDSKFSDTVGRLKVIKELYSW